MDDSALALRGSGMGAAMIDWVHDYCCEWGRAKRRLLSSEDGWPSRSMLGRLIEEGAVGAAQSGTVRNHYPEVLEGRALEVNTALRRMMETHQMELQCWVVFAHYVVKGHAKGKAVALDIKVDDYWKHLHAGHCFIAAHFPTAPAVEQKREVSHAARY